MDVAELLKERQPAPLTTEPIDAEDADLAIISKPPRMVSPTATVGQIQEQVASMAIERQPASITVDDFERGLEPQNLAGAYKLACGLHESRLYQKFPNAQAIWAVMIRGRELGLGVGASLDNFHVIEGKPAPHAHLIIARAKAHPKCEYFHLVESTAESATYETKHRDEPKETRRTYTLEMAKQAGLVPERPRLRNPTPGEKDRRSNWEKRPDDMLRKTCAVQLARIVYPDAAQGLYAVEELENG